MRQACFYSYFIARFEKKNISNLNIKIKKKWLISQFIFIVYLKINNIKAAFDLLGCLWKKIKIKLLGGPCFHKQVIQLWSESLSRLICDSYHKKMLLRIVATVYTYLPLAWMTFSSVVSRQAPLLLPSPIIWSYHKKETCSDCLISSIVTIQTCSECLISSIVTIQTCSECLSWPKTNTRY